MRHHPSAHNHAFISSYQLRGGGNRLFLGLSSHCGLVVLGERLGLTLLAVLLPKRENPSAKTQSTRTSAKGRTNLPLGELQVHLATTLSGGTGLLLERAADRTGSDGHVAVVAIPRERQSWVEAALSGKGKAYVRPAAFQKDILTVN